MPGTEETLRGNLGSGPFSLGISITDRRIERLLEAVPRLTFFHLRDTMGAIYGSHRREWLQRTRVNFRRGGMRAGRLRTDSSGTSGRSARRTFQYEVVPAQTPPPGARIDAGAIEGQTYSLSRVALGLEQGGTFTARGGRLLAIPIGVTLDSQGRPKSRWVTPTAYRRAGSRNELVALQLGTKRPVLYQVKGGRSRRAAETSGAIGQRSGGRTRILLPAYQLVPRVRRRPLLRYLETWEELASDRARRLGVAASKIVADAERGRQV